MKKLKEAIHDYNEYHLKTRNIFSLIKERNEMVQVNQKMIKNALDIDEF
jgi:hypothetical protein